METRLYSRESDKNTFFRKNQIIYRVIRNKAKYPRNKIRFDKQDETFDTGHGHRIL